MHTDIWGEERICCKSFPRPKGVLKWSEAVRV